MTIPTGNFGRTAWTRSSDTGQADRAGRARAHPFHPQLKIDIRECEPLLQAMFDIICNEPNGERPISVHEAATLAMKYATRGSN